jgi:hypothetical protein
MRHGIQDKGLFLDSATDDDVSRVVAHWGFPMVELDLSELKVPRDHLREQEQRILADWTY